MTANYPVDLHSHTNLSDGSDSVCELVENAAALGLKVLALTDHDVLPPSYLLLPDGSSRLLTQWAAEKGLCLLRGVEFSCESQIEDVHIVGLGCDWSDSEIQAVEKGISESKAEAYEETVRRLNERGYSFTMDELLNYGGRTIDIFSLQKKRIFDLLAGKGFVSDWVEAKLLVRDDKYLNVNRQKPSATYIINVIHQAGGIAILAHPYLIDSDITLDGREIKRWEYIEYLIKNGLDGIEARYTYGKTTCQDKRPSAEIWAEVIKQVDGRLIISGGSDYHADRKKNNPNPRELGECGLTMEEFLSEPIFKKLYTGIIG